MRACMSARTCARAWCCVCACMRVITCARICQATRVPACACVHVHVHLLPTVQRACFDHKVCGHVQDDFAVHQLEHAPLGQFLSQHTYDTHPCMQMHVFRRVLCSFVPVDCNVHEPRGSQNWSPAHFPFSSGRRMLAMPPPLDWS